MANSIAMAPSPPAQDPPTPPGQPPSHLRLFVSLPLPQNIRQALHRLQAKIPADLYRPTPPESLHLTLYFLGETPADTVPTIVERLAAVSFPPLDLTLGKILHLPQPEVPKIIAVALGGDLQALNRLQRAVHDVCYPLAANQETRPFVPHLTLARLKSTVPASAKAVKKALANLPTPPPAAFQPANIHLVQSQLSKSGPTYATIRAFP